MKVDVIVHTKRRVRRAERRERLRQQQRAVTRGIQQQQRQQQQQQQQEQQQEQEQEQEQEQQQHAAPVRLRSEWASALPSPPRAQPSTPAVVVVGHTWHATVHIDVLLCRCDRVVVPHRELK